MNSLPIVVLFALTLLASPSWSAAPTLECTRLADEKRLTAAPRASYLRKCEVDASGGVLAACEKEAAAKKLNGAARNGHMKKCLAEKTKIG